MLLDKNEPLFQSVAAASLAQHTLPSALASPVSRRRRLSAQGSFALSREAGGGTCATLAVFCPPPRTPSPSSLLPSALALGCSSGRIYQQKYFSLRFLASAVVYVREQCEEERKVNSGCLLSRPPPSRSLWVSWLHLLKTPLLLSHPFVMLSPRFRELLFTSPGLGVVETPSSAYLAQRPACSLVFFLDLYNNSLKVLLSAFPVYSAWVCHLPPAGTPDSLFVGWHLARPTQGYCVHLFWNICDTLIAV